LRLIIKDVTGAEASLTRRLDGQRTGDCKPDIKDRIWDLIHSLHTNHVDKDDHKHKILFHSPRCRCVCMFMTRLVVNFGGAVSFELELRPTSVANQHSGRLKNGDD
jgi:hypothetical protein